MIKVGLYSITYSGIWYKGGHLTIKDMIRKAKALGYDGIEIDLKRPHGFPLDLDEKSRTEIRKLAESEGIEIPAVAGNNNFASPIPEHRENELLMVHEQIRLARDLGAKILRVFAAWRGITFRNEIATYDVVIEYEKCQNLGSIKLERWNWVRECLKEAAGWAEKYGVVLALQNHIPLIENYRDMLAMVREVGSEYLKCCLDVPCEPCQDDDYVIKSVKETGELQIHSHFSGEYIKNSDGEAIYVPHPWQPVRVNFPVFIKALKESGYNGYMDFEFCHPAVDNHQPAGIEFIDKQAKYALEYMRNLIQTA